MIHLKAALFDLDGVVFDTESQYTVFWGSMCRRYHPEHPGLEHEIKGQTLDQIYERWWAGNLKKERQVVTRLLDEFESQMHFDYVPGFETLLADLSRNGVRTAVVTSSNRVKMESVYRQRPEFQALFDAILTSEDFAESKPSPDCYQRGAARLGAKPAECIVFEDSFNGLKAGRAAGMCVVGMATTNPASAIAPLSDLQTADYLNLSFQRLNGLLALRAASDNLV